MPDAKLVLYDFADGLPLALAGETFHCVISAYAIHHIKDDKKVALVEDLSLFLNPVGLILIGDVAFETRAEMEKVKATAIGWDDSEFYMIADEIIPGLECAGMKAQFTKTSFCSGVLNVYA